MSATDDLLPTNATALERELAALSARIDEIDPTPIEWTWDAWRCPSALLPWLAWALSVDVWEDSWDEVRKRQAIADSPAHHRLKGTRKAVEDALGFLQRPYELAEWHEQMPEGRRGTANIFIPATMAEAPALRRRARALIHNAKPKSRAIWLGVGERSGGVFRVAGGVLGEALTTIQPYAYAGQEVQSAFRVGGGILVETLTTVGAAFLPLAAAPGSGLAAEPDIALGVNFGV